MKSLTVLIAEDDLLSRMVLERSVVQWGYKMLSAVDGEYAIQTLQSRPVDVCVMDWDMPGMAGIEVCKWVRNNLSNPTPYVVMITSRNRPQEIQQGYEAGADDYLTKPCDLRYLRRRIATFAEKRQRQEQWLEEAQREAAGYQGIAGLSPLDLYLSDLRLMRNKT